MITIHLEHLQQSLPVCCSLAALGGILEVGATAVTAVPAVREKEGIEMKWWTYLMALAGNIGLQAIGSLLSHLIAPWFGPVSIVVPFFYSATLLSNMFVFGVLLGEEFTKNMKVGTYVIVVAVILLPVVGPNIQEDQDVGTLFRHWYASLWFIMLLAASGITGVLLALDISKYSMKKRTVVLLIARGASLSTNLTVSRSFILGLSHPVLVLFIIIKLLSGFVYTYAVLIQSRVVEQATFVPLNAITVVIANAVTGIIIWEDWRVVQSWYGYFCVFVLLGLGCDLLLSVPLLNSENPEFGAPKRAAMIMQGRRKRRQSLPLLRASELSAGYSEVPDVDEQLSSSFDPPEKKVAWESEGEDDDKHRSKTFAWRETISPVNLGNKMGQATNAGLTTPKKLGEQAMKTPVGIGDRGKQLVASAVNEGVEREEGSSSSLSITRKQAWKETISPMKNMKCGHHHKERSMTK
jgi:hypothetical protein